MSTLFDFPTRSMKAKAKQHGKRGKLVYRRRIRYVEELPGEIHCFEIYSLSRADVPPHHTQADMLSGKVLCDCERFRFKESKHDPHIHDTDHHCEHITRALAWLDRRNMLVSSVAELRPCFECSMPDAEYEVADESGDPVPGQFICRCCVREKNTKRTGGYKWGLP